MPEVTVEELKAKIDRGEDVFMLDVREPNEYQICRIPGSKLIPLGELPQRSGEARPQSRHGRPLQDGRPQREGRGAAAGRGFTRVRNLKGGILDVDRQGRSDAVEVLEPEDLEFSRTRKTRTSTDEHGSGKTSWQPRFAR